MQIGGSGSSVDVIDRLARQVGVVNRQTSLKYLVTQQQLFFLHEKLTASSQVPMFQLLNPTGSGVTAQLLWVQLSENSNVPFVIAFYDTDITGATNDGVNLYSGGIASKVYAAGELLSAVLTLTPLYTFTPVADNYYTFDFLPVVLPPGKGVVIGCTLAQSPVLTGELLWREY